MVYEIFKDKWIKTWAKTLSAAIFALWKYWYRSIYACWCYQSTPQFTKITQQDRKQQKGVKHKGIIRMLRGRKLRRKRRINDIRLRGPPWPAWLFQNESNDRPGNEKKKREKNQYGAIKHKASLGGVEGNLLFIKFTPPSPSPSKPQTSLQLLMHELPLHLVSSLQVIWPLWFRLDWNDCGRRAGKSGVFSLIDPSHHRLCWSRWVALVKSQVSPRFYGHLLANKVLFGFIFYSRFLSRQQKIAFIYKIAPKPKHTLTVCVKPFE